jgi:hypothetical protein
LPFHLLHTFYLLVNSLELNKKRCQATWGNFAARLQSAPQQFLLGGRELFIAQRARLMQLGELLNLGRQICRRRRLNRSCVLRRGGRILLGLCILLGLRIGSALLIGLIILLLRRSILPRPLLLLVVVYRTGSASDDRCAYNSATYARYRSSNHCSSA